MKMTKAEKLMKKAKAGELPAAVPFDDPPLDHPYRAQIWPEQYVVDYDAKGPDDSYWHLVTLETWCAKRRDSHDDVERACIAYHQARGIQIHIRRVLFC